MGFPLGIPFARDRSDCEPGDAGAAVPARATAAAGSPRSDPLKDDRSPARRSLAVLAFCDPVTASTPLQVRRGVALAETCFVVRGELHGEGQGVPARARPGWP
jgi:hypothetical protein